MQAACAGFCCCAGVLVTVPADNRRLVLERADVAAALDRSGINYLFVTSRPPREVKRGAAFTYRVQVKSKKGGLRFNLDAGPEGMMVSPEGVVSWEVPARFAEKEADVILTVTDGGGQERFHTFRLRIPD